VVQTPLVLEASDREAIRLVGVVPAALPTARAEVAKPSTGSRGLRGRPEVGARTEGVEAAKNCPVNIIKVEIIDKY
jgi:hypothetical protein